MVSLRLVTVCLLVCFVYCEEEEKIEEKNVEEKVDETTDDAEKRKPLIDGVNWVSLKEAYELGKSTGKPILLAITTTWCAHCHELRTQINEKKMSARIKRLAEHFIMVSDIDDSEDIPEELEPDGRYVPRIMFLDSNGNLMPQFQNVLLKDKDHFYNYMEADQVVRSMKTVMEEYNKGEFKLASGDEEPEKKRGESEEAVKEEGDKGKFEAEEIEEEESEEDDEKETKEEGNDDKSEKDEETKGGKTDKKTQKTEL